MSSAKGRKKSHRSQGESEDRGIAKSWILTYIADNWEGDRGPSKDDIELHLKKNNDIGEKTGVDKHIMGLLETGLIAVATDADGKEYFKLKESFEYFHRAFNHVHKCGCSTGFMETKYCQRKLKSSGFQLKLIIHVIRSTILYLVQYLKPKKEYIDTARTARRIAKAGGHPELTNNIIGVIEDVHTLNEHGKLQRPPCNEWSAAFIEAAEYCRKYDADQIGHMLFQWDEEQKMDIDTFEFLFTPLTDAEKEEFVFLLTGSPGAVDVVLNQKGYEPVKLIVSMMAYYMKAILMEKKKRELIADMNNNGCKMSPEEALTAVRTIFDFSNITSNTPIIVAMRNAFERDRINGKLAKNEYTIKVMAEFATPKLKEDE